MCLHCELTFPPLALAVNASSLALAHERVTVPVVPVRHIQNLCIWFAADLTSSTTFAAADTAALISFLKYKRCKQSKEIQHQKVQNKTITKNLNI